MLQALKNIVEKWGCKHEWKEYNRHETFDPNLGLETPVNVYATLICKKCGKITKIRL